MLLLDGRVGLEDGLDNVGGEIVLEPVGAVRLRLDLGQEGTSIKKTRLMLLIFKGTVHRLYMGNLPNRFQLRNQKNETHIKLTVEL